MKRCFKCLRVLDLSQFYKHAQMGDGHLNKCKECTKKDVLEHRQANLERIRQYDRLRGGLPHRVAARREYDKTTAGKSAHARAVASYFQADKRRMAAQNAIARAVRSGKLTRWPCEVCGHEKSEAHHPHYGSPLLVTWLCGPHHKQVHKMVSENK